MENYKVKVGSEAESKEAQGFLFELGYRWFSGGNQVQHLKQSCSSSFGYLVAWSTGCFTNVIQCGGGDEDAKELTIPQLKDMVVLKRNDVLDATHTDGHYSFYVGKDENYFFSSCDKAWRGTWKNVEILKPIEKPMKEYLNKLEDGTYKLVLLDSVADGVDGLIEVPDGSDIAFQAFSNSPVVFKRSECGYSNAVIVWQRETQPEALPFIDDEPKYDPEDIGIAKGCDLDELAKECKFRDRYDGETDEDYRAMLEQYIPEETLNDKVASAEVARQSGVFVGASFDDSPEFNFEAVDDFVESNVEQGVKHAHYKKDISHLDTLDIYRVTELFNPHACGAHIAKKALCSGQRGHKDLLTDIQDIIDTAERWKEMLIEDEKAK